MPHRIGAITIGQSPRTDVIPDMQGILGPDVTIIEAGALDGLSRDKVAELAPGTDDQVLVTRMRDGTAVRVAGRLIVPRLQFCIEEMESQVGAILLLCTGTFAPFASSRPILYPERILFALAAATAPEAHLGIITPDERQIPEQQKRWSAVSPRVTVLAASPYESSGELERLARELVGADLLVLDSLGYSAAMKAVVRAASGKPVLLPRTVLARAAAELL
jgi:protein AroM